MFMFKGSPCTLELYSVQCTARQMFTVYRTLRTLRPAIDQSNKSVEIHSSSLVSHIQQIYTNIPKTQQIEIRVKIE